MCVVSFMFIFDVVGKGRDLFSGTYYKSKGRRSKVRFRYDRSRSWNLLTPHWMIGTGIRRKDSRVSGSSGTGIRTTIVRRELRVATSSSSSAEDSLGELKVSIGGGTGQRAPYRRKRVLISDVGRNSWVKKLDYRTL